jgi:hypothetical protein
LLKGVAVGDRVAPAPPHRSRRAAFPHRAPVEGRTRLDFGALAAHYTSNPQARSFGYTPYPALRPGRAALLAFPSTDRLPSTISATDFWSALFEASSVLCSRPTPHLSPTASSPRLPAAARTVSAVAGKVRSPRFRRVPFVRDGVSDLGRAPAPRIAAPYMLPSTLRTVSASAVYRFRGSITHPTQLLCTLRRGRHLPRRNTRYQAGAAPYLDRSSTGWTAPASPGARVIELDLIPIPTRPSVSHVHVRLSEKL